jgi:hypothetical protein
LKQTVRVLLVVSMLDVLLASAVSVSAKPTGTVDVQLPSINDLHSSLTLSSDQTVARSNRAGGARCGGDVSQNLYLGIQDCFLSSLVLFMVQLWCSINHYPLEENQWL